MNMKAIKVEVVEHEWDKVCSFVEYVNDVDVLAYQISRTAFIVVTEGDCSMARVEAMIAARFEYEIHITNIRK